MNALLSAASKPVNMKHGQNVADYLKRIIHVARGIDTTPAYEALQRFERAPWREDAWAQVNTGEQHVEFEPRVHVTSTSTTTEAVARLVEILDAYCERVS